MTPRSLWATTLLGLCLAGCSCASAPPATVDAGAAPDALVPDTDGGPLEDAATSTDFRILSMGHERCRAIDVAELVGVQTTMRIEHDAIGVGGSSVVTSGPSSTASFPLDLPDGILSSVARNVLVSDVETRQLFALADADGPVVVDALGAPSRQVTRLMALDDRAAPTGRSITLGMPVDLDYSPLGVFAGRGEIGITSRDALFVIDVRTGAVSRRRRPAFSTPPYGDWSFRGLLERVGDARALVLVPADGESIVRVDVDTDVTETIQAFDDLGFSPSIAAAVSEERWYFHVQGHSQLTIGHAGALSDVIGYCPAMFDTTGADFVVGKLDVEGCDVADVVEVTGGGEGIVLTSDYAFVNGERLGRWDLDLRDVVATRVPGHAIGWTMDAIVSDPSTGQMWVLATDESTLTPAGGDVTRLVGIGADAEPLPSVVTLSHPIALAPRGSPDGARTGLFAGWGEIAIHDATHLWLVSLASGEVRDLGAMAAPSGLAGGMTYTGVLERVGTDRYVVYLRGGGAPGATPAIVRVLVPSGEPTEILRLEGASPGICSLAIAPTIDRWYFAEHASAPWAGPGDRVETLGFCEASVVTPSQ